MARIYHYTKINTLELMLQNGTIRLNALKNMDDLLEGRSQDDFDFSHYYFASSWTMCGEESIPLWFMYTDKMKGVRIEANDNFLSVDEDIKDCHIKNCVDDRVLAFKIHSKDDDGFLVPVEYTEEKPKFLTGHPRGYIAEENYKMGVKTICGTPSTMQTSMHRSISICIIMTTMSSIKQIHFIILYRRWWMKTVII